MYPRPTAFDRSHSHLYIGCKIAPHGESGLSCDHFHVTNLSGDRIFFTGPFYGSCANPRGYQEFAVSAKSHLQDSSFPSHHLLNPSNTNNQVLNASHTDSHYLSARPISNYLHNETFPSNHIIITNSQSKRVPISRRCPIRYLKPEASGSGEIEREGSLLMDHGPRMSRKPTSLVAPSDYSATSAQGNSATAPELRYRRESSGCFTCVLDNCHKRISRLSDLPRHYESRHVRSNQYTCRASPLCPRALRGFPRKDKRDDHERKVHRFDNSKAS
jgi:hypothetical protein